MLLEERFGQVWVEGELSNLHKHRSGHWYFTLKDDKAQLSCAMFAGSNRRVRFPVKDGDQVLLRGRVSLYEARGNFQLIVEQLEPAGEGALRAAFDALKVKLAEEGLFDDARKRPLPERPARIAVISSATGAAIQDFLHTLERRFRALEVWLLPVPVQGDQAGPAIVRALERLAELPVEVAVVTRGGGSLEDLWAFNLESVARAIAAAPVPVVSAVGHQTDITIADFVADLRAATPTAAAELITPDGNSLLAGLGGIEGALTRLIDTRLNALALELRERRARLKDPRRALQQQMRHADELEARLQRQWQRELSARRTRLRQLAARLARQLPTRKLETLKGTLADRRNRLGSLAAEALTHRQNRLTASLRTLDAVSPAKTLDRGFAAMLDSSNAVISDAAQAPPGTKVTTYLKRGALSLTVNEQHLDAGLLTTSSVQPSTPENS